MLRTLARRPKRFLKQTASFLMGAAVVLLYHRVYDTDFDPLLLSVSPDNFDAQMTYLRRRYALLSTISRCMCLMLQDFGEPGA